MAFLRELLKKETLTEKLLKYTDDYEIYCELIGSEPEIGECISSPIRASDDFPSFALYIPTRLMERGYEIRPEEIWFKDLADGRYGDIFKFVKYYAFHHFALDLDTKYEIVKFIDSQLNLGMFDNNDGQVRERVIREYVPKVSKNLYYKTRKFTKKDKEYWSKLHLDVEDLEFFNVSSVQYLLEENGSVRKEFYKNNLAFVYKIWDKEKLYQPEAIKSMKFRNTCPGDDFMYYQGFPQLTGKPDILIITKSMKDVMVFWKFFNKILNIPVDVVAPAAESIKLSEKFIEVVKQNYEKTICVSDYDLAGVKFANQCKRLGYEYKFIDTKRVLINDKYKVLDKDISDFLVNNGYEATIKLLETWKLKKPLKKSILSII